MKYDDDDQYTSGDTAYCEREASVTKTYDQTRRTAILAIAIKYLRTISFISHLSSLLWRPCEKTATIGVMPVFTSISPHIGPKARDLVDDARDDGSRRLVTCSTCEGGVGLSHKLAK